MKKEVPDFPQMIVLETSFKCNATCPHCPYRHSNIRDSYGDRPFMTFNTFRKIADEVGAYESLLRLTGGGEPTMHPQITKFVEYGKDAGCDVALITNGSKLNKDMLESMLDAGINTLEFSVDAGSKEEYAKARGLDWNHINDIVAAAMSMRNDYKPRTRVIASVIKSPDVDHAAAHEYWRTRVDFVQMREFLTWGYMEQHPEFKKKPLENPCPHLYDRISIDSKGSVTYCSHDIGFKYAFGNIHSGTIRHLWHGLAMSLMRQRHESGSWEEIDLCKNCEDRYHKLWGKLYWDFLEKTES